MALTRKKSGKAVEDSELEATDASVAPQGGTDDDDLDAFLDGLGSSDQISIERKSPLDLAGYVGSVPWDPGLDIVDEIQRAYGGGTYLIRVKTQAKGGRILYRKGSRHIRIAGEPRREKSLAVMQPTSPFGTVDVQEKILEAIAKAGAGQKDSAQTVELVRSIMQIATQQNGGGGETNALSQLLAAAEAGKKLAGMFGGTASPARSRDDDDDDDDDDEGGDPTDRMMNKAFQLMMMKMMQGNAAPAAAPAQALGAAESLRNAQGPQMLRGAQNPPGPPPNGMKWVKHPKYGFVLVADEPVPVAMRSDPKPPSPPVPGTHWVKHPRLGWVMVWSNDDDLNLTAPPNGMRWVLFGGKHVLIADSSPQNAGQNRKSADTLPDPHQSGGVEGPGDGLSHEKKKRSIERVETCPRCNGAATAEVCSFCNGNGKVRVNMNTKPTNEEWASVGVTESLNPVCKQCGSLNLTYATDGGETMRCEDCRHEQAAALEETDSATGQQRPVYEGFQGDSKAADILRVCITCNGDGYERSSETDEQIGICPTCEGQGITLNLAPRPSAARPDELIGDKPDLYTNDDGEPVQCNDADCEGWLFAIHGGDTLQCATCGALHDLNGEIIEDDSDDDESEPPTPDEWAQDFAEMPHDEKEEALRVLAKKLGVSAEIAEMLIANMPKSEGGEDEE